jgi:hypothetical protein
MFVAQIKIKYSYTQCNAEHAFINRMCKPAFKKEKKKKVEDKKNHNKVKAPPGQESFMRTRKERVFLLWLSKGS